ncbi:phenylalanine 4-monooxygenase, partial [Vibrio vulnificus]
MMSHYHSKPVDSEGFVEWTEEEDAIWQDLITRQLSMIQGRACSAYIDGLALLDLPTDRVPQLPEINQVLAESTG